MSVIRIFSCTGDRVLYVCRFFRIIPCDRHSASSLRIVLIILTVWPIFGEARTCAGESSSLIVLIFFIIVRVLFMRLGKLGLWTIGLGGRMLGLWFLVLFCFFSFLFVRVYELFLYELSVLFIYVYFDLYIYILHRRLYIHIPNLYILYIQTIKY